MKKIPSKPPWTEDRRKWAHVWNLSNNIHFQESEMILPLSLYNLRSMANGSDFYKEKETGTKIMSRVKLICTISYR